MDEADSSALAVILAEEAQSSLSCRGGGQFHHSVFLLGWDVECERSSVVPSSPNCIYTAKSTKWGGKNRSDQEADGG